MGSINASAKESTQKKLLDSIAKIIELSCEKKVTSSEEHLKSHLESPVLDEAQKKFYTHLDKLLAETREPQHKKVSGIAACAPMTPTEHWDPFPPMLTPNGNPGCYTNFNIKSEQKYHPATQMFLDLLDRMKAISLSKSHDYAGSDDPMSNFRQCEAMGLPAWKGIVVRLTDKLSRVQNFCKQESFLVKDESVEDTLIDMANYALLCIIMYREYQAKQNNQKSPLVCSSPMYDDSGC